jgi:nucleotide-binding universal stress UspA family protein
MSKCSVIIPLDASPFSRRIVPYIRHVLDADQFACVLLHVADPVRGRSAVPPLPVAAAWPQAMYTTSTDIEYALHPIYDIQQEDSARAAAECALLDVQQQLETAGFETTLEVQFGDPANEIAAAVQRHGAALIVMATHGRTGVRHMALGSVAEDVVRHASVPVLLVGPAAGDMRKARRITY